MQICRLHPFEQMHRHWNADNGRQAVTRLQRAVLGVVGLLVLLCACSAPDAAAQTPAATIEDGGGTTVLESYADGALLAPGTFNTGTIPATGAGTRLMWYPAKAAFRVGQVGGSQWDASNVGDYSIAVGRNTTANNSGAVAMGVNSTASGLNAMAMGDDAAAFGAQATAMGFNTVAETDNSLTIGSYNDANGSPDNSLFVAGNGTSGTPSDALVLDKDAGLVVGGAFGTGTIPASGSGTRAMWHPKKAAFRAGRALGTVWDDSNVGNFSVAFGGSAMASGRGSVAMGIETTAGGKGAVALGNDAKATGNQAGAMGFGTIAKTSHSFTLGRCNKANSPAGGNALFVVGNGTITTGSCQRGTPTAALSDALVLDGSGNLTISGTLTQNSDRRLKTDIESLGSGTLEKIARLRPVRYQFKNQDTHPRGEQIGLVAQDVQKEFPELVKGEESDYLSLSYSKLTAVLLKGLQEQQTQIEQQKDQIEDQEARIETLEAENDAIKKRLAALEAQQSASTAAGGWAWGIGLALAVGGVGGVVARRTWA